MPISPVVIGYVLAVGAGVSFVFQQAVNANLRGELGSIWWAGFVSYLGGTLVMLGIALLFAVDLLLLLILPSLLIMHLGVVMLEEQYLEKKFVYR